MKAENLQDVLTASTAELGVDTGDLLKESYLLDLLPSAVYVCDITGVIWRYNQKAVDLWGRRPNLGDRDDRFCGAFRLFRPDGKLLPHHETPAAACLADGKPRRNIEVIIERPDLSRITANVNIVPIRNSHGTLIGMLNCFNDITEQKNTERELNRHRYELQDYVDNATIGLHWIDDNGIIVWANNAELQMLGYSADEYIGHHVSEFHADPEKINDIMERFCGSDSLHDYESTMKCKDGSTRIVSINSSVFRENGKFIHTRCFTVDITEKKKYLKALEDSERWNRQLLESLPASVYTCDTEGKITSLNQASVSLWGRKPELGVDLWCGSWKMYDADGTVLPLETCPMAIALKEGRAVRGREIIIERPDGTRRVVLPHPTPIYDTDGKVTGAVNMHVDITELRKIESALKESEDRFRKAADSAPVLFWMADAAGERILYNRSWQEFTGIRSDKIKHWQTCLHPEDRKTYLDVYNAAFKGQKEFKIEYRLKRKDGTYVWLLEHGVPRYNSEKRFEGFLGSCIDIEEKRIYTHALENEVDRRTKELKQAYHRLQRYNEQLEQFTYTASHDLKEPLRKIALYNKHVYEALESVVSEKQREYLERSITATERMQKLIEDLLAYSTTASNIPNLETVNLTQILKEVIDSHKFTIEEKKALIQFDELPIIQGIPFQIRQLFDNIIGNALKYSNEGKRPVIRITDAVLRGSDISIPEADINDVYHKISVADNGIGFDDEYAIKIFNLFQRLPAGNEFPGSGIGLAICKKIAQNHQGYITATATPGYGATFDIYLPA